MVEKIHKNLIESYSKFIKQVKVPSCDVSVCYGLSYYFQLKKTTTAKLFINNTIIMLINGIVIIYL